MESNQSVLEIKFLKPKLYADGSCLQLIIWHLLLFCFFLHSLEQYSSFLGPETNHTLAVPVSEDISENDSDGQKIECEDVVIKQDEEEAST